VVVARAGVVPPQVPPLSAVLVEMEETVLVGLEVEREELEMGPMALQALEVEAVAAGTALEVTMVATGQQGVSGMRHMDQAEVVGAVEVGGIIRRRELVGRMEGQAVPELLM
jgi:hypothetical protein